MKGFDRCEAEMQGSSAGLKLQHVVLFIGCLITCATISVSSQDDISDGPRDPVFGYRLDLLDPSYKSKYYSNKRGTQVIEIGPDNDCHIYHDDDALWLREIKSDRMTELNYFQFRLMLGKCRLEAFFKPLDFDWNRTKNPYNETERARSSSGFVRFSDSNEFPQLNSTSVDENQDDDEFFLSGAKAGPELSIPIIFPGTLWCGKGSHAKRTHELGIYTETDRCCRDHDQCSENMPGKSCKYEICNDSDYTRSHCDCDERFRYCLQQDRSFSSLISFKLANLYFNVLKPMCYDHRHPIKYCKKHRITGECTDFEYDYNYPPIWQFFPAKPYATVSDVVEKIINPLPPDLERPPPPPPNRRPPPPPPPPPRPGGIRFPEEEDEDEDHEEQRS